jgi:hypothetical protein
MAIKNKTKAIIESVKRVKLLRFDSILAESSFNRISMFDFKKVNPRWIFP